MQSQAHDPDFQYLAVDKNKVQQEAPPFDAKKNVWIPDAKDGFVRGEIQSTKGDDVIVKNEKTLLVRTVCYDHTANYLFSQYKD